MWEARVIETGDEIGVEFFYMSPDGEEGYPGNLNMKVMYRLNNNNEFLISYNGVCDQKILLNGIRDASKEDIIIVEYDSNESYSPRYTLRVCIKRLKYTLNIY